MAIQTDSTPIEDPKNFKSCNVYKIFKLIADNKSVIKMEQNYSKEVMDMDMQKELLEYILSHFSKERDRFNYYMSNKDELDKVLNEGAQKANSSI